MSKPILTLAMLALFQYHYAEAINHTDVTSSLFSLTSSAARQVDAHSRVSGSAPSVAKMALTSAAESALILTSTRRVSVAARRCSGKERTILSTVVPATLAMARLNGSVTLGTLNSASEYGMVTRRST